jgi:hypothetical protein
MKQNACYLLAGCAFMIVGYALILNLWNKTMLNKKITFNASVTALITPPVCNILTMDNTSVYSSELPHITALQQQSSSFLMTNSGILEGDREDNNKSEGLTSVTNASIAQPLQHFYLPNGTLIALPYIPESMQNSVPFRPSISLEEYNVYLELLHTLDKVCHRINVTCHLSYGSLLGSYRHHGIVPWDDDVDIMYDIADNDKLVRALNTISSNFKAVQSSLHGINFWKFYHTKKSHPCKHWPWSWPFIDMFPLVSINSSHVKEPVFKHVYAKSSIWPSCRHPFGSVFFDSKILLKIY